MYDPTQYQTLLTRLIESDPTGIAWHAARYDSAYLFRAMMEVAQSDAADAESPQTASDLRRTIAKIAAACLEDGADYGRIPCLGGPFVQLWAECLYFLNHVDADTGHEVSTGSLLITADAEYYARDNNVYRASLANPLDIHGYRQGGRWECFGSRWPIVASMIRGGK